MTDKEWIAMVDLAVGYMSLATKERQLLYHDDGLSIAEKSAQDVINLRFFAREILRLALSPEDALGAAQRG